MDDTGAGNRNPNLLRKPLPLVLVDTVLQKPWEVFSDSSILWAVNLRFVGGDWIAQTHKMELRNDPGAWKIGKHIYWASIRLIFQSSRNSMHVSCLIYKWGFWNWEIMYLIERKPGMSDSHPVHPTFWHTAAGPGVGGGCRAWTKPTQCTQRSEHNTDTLLMFAIWNLWSSAQAKLKCT